MNGDDEPSWMPSFLSVMCLLAGVAAFYGIPLAWGSDFQITYGRLFELPLVALWYVALILLRYRRSGPRAPELTVQDIVRAHRDDEEV